MIKRDVIECGVPEQRVRDIERIQALVRKWTGGSTSGDLGAQVAFLERFLPATFRDVAPEYARAAFKGPRGPARSRCGSTEPTSTWLRTGPSTERT